MQTNTPSLKPSKMPIGCENKSHFFIHRLRRKILVKNQKKQWPDYKFQYSKFQCPKDFRQGPKPLPTRRCRSRCGSSGGPREQKPRDPQRDTRMFLL